MTMNITERQKEIIESSGHYVIEFKLWCKKLSAVITDVWRAIIVWLNDVMEKVVLPAFRILTEKIDDIFDFIKSNIDSRTKYADKKHKWSICKKVVSHYRLYITRHTVYHCRNNC